MSMHLWCSAYRNFFPWIVSGEVGALFAPETINTERDEDEDQLPVVPLLALEVSYLF